MNFEKGHLYHVCNQGNNRQKIFFRRENYYFFLKKIREQILPHADVLAWCLMPNHFHLLVLPRQDSRSATLLNHHTHQMTLSHQMSDLTKSIAVMLRSYTRAINIQENRTGSLFKPHTKAQCLTKIEGATPAYLNTNYGTLISMQTPENEYPQVCFNYIHQNPVKANLVAKPEDWEFSSYRDYCGLRTHDGLVNMEIAKEFFPQYTSDDSKSSDVCHY